MLFPQPPPLTRLEHRAQESLLDAGLGECNICGRPFKIKSGGLTKHRKACADEQAAKAEMARSRERREELDRRKLIQSSISYFHSNWAFRAGRTAEKSIAYH